MLARQISVSLDLEYMHFGSLFCYHPAKMRKFKPQVNKLSNYYSNNSNETSGPNGISSAEMEYVNDLTEQLKAGNIFH